MQRLRPLLVLFFALYAGLSRAELALEEFHIDSPGPNVAEYQDSPDYRLRMWAVMRKLNDLVTLREAVATKTVQVEHIEEVRKLYFAQDLVRIQSALPMSILFARAKDRDNFWQETDDSILINRKGYTGQPVVYVNGLGTTVAQAREEALTLSRHLERPVRLFYYPSQTPELDFAQATVDRLQPFQKLYEGRIVLRTYDEKQKRPHVNDLRQNDGIAPILRSYSKITAQLASYLIKQGKEPVSIVSHSTGAVLVRNALLVSNVFLYRRLNTSWVATGFPLKREEIYPEPFKFRIITEDDDDIAKQLSNMEFDSTTLGNKLARERHDFFFAYLPSITKDDILPADYKADFGLQYTEDCFEGPAFYKGGIAAIEMTNSCVRVTNEEGMMTRGSIDFSDRKIHVNPEGGWKRLSGLLDEGLFWSNTARWLRVNQAR